MAENARLNEEVADLKRSLIRLETLRGIAQVPLPDAVSDTGPTPAPPQPAPQIQHQDKNEKDAKPAEKKSKTKDKAPKKEKPPPAEEEGEHWVMVQYLLLAYPDRVKLLREVQHHEQI